MQDIKQRCSNRPCILGLDPGTIITGYGLIESDGSDHVAVDYGCIRPPSRFQLSQRYEVLFNCLEELLKHYKPTSVVVEAQFVKKNPQVAIKLGMAKGVAILAARKQSIPIFEYAPGRAKKAVVGKGRATKQQVQWMVKQLLKLSVMPKPEDAADALALALCHAMVSKIPQLLPKEI